jgi:hypothetical protein
VKVTPRHRVVLGGVMVAAQDAGHDDACLVDRHVREGPLPDDVAERPDTGRCAHVIIDGHPALGLVDADGRGADRGQVGAASGGHQQRRRPQLLAVCERHGESGIAALAGRVGRASRSHTRAHADALAAEHLSEQGSCLRLVRREQLAEGLDNHDLGAESRENLGQLRSDCPAAEHDQRLRHLPGLDGLAIGPERSAGQSGDGRYRRRGPVAITTPRLARSRSSPTATTPGAMIRP